MTDIVERVLIAKNMSASELFRDAYKKTPDPDNWTWAKELYFRSGVITRAVELHCKAILNIRPPHEQPDYPEAHTENFR